MKIEDYKVSFRLFASTDGTVKDCHITDLNSHVLSEFSQDYKFICYYNGVNIFEGDIDYNNDLIKIDVLSYPNNVLHGLRNLKYKNIADHVKRKIGITINILQNDLDSIKKKRDMLLSFQSHRDE